MTTTPSFEHAGPPPDRPELPAGVERPPVFTRGRIPTGSPERADLPRWPPWAPFAAMLLTLVIAIAGATAITVIAQLAGVDVSANRTPAGIEIGGTGVPDNGAVVSG